PEIVLTNHQFALACKLQITLALQVLFTGSSFLVMRPWYLDTVLLTLCQVVKRKPEWSFKAFPIAMRKASGSVLAAPPPSKKASARVALVDIKEPTRALLSDCFKQFGIEAVTMTGSVPERMQREKFEACVLSLRDRKSTRLN